MRPVRLLATVAPPRLRVAGTHRRANHVACFFLAAWGLGAACSPAASGAGVVALSAGKFSSQLGAAASPLLLDVRTPGEFAKGHLPHAVNIDWYARDFERHVAGLDRTRPVFVYCLSGDRSAKAARRLAADGFARVYDLAGGIISWRAAGLPQAAAETVPRGLTRAEFDRLVDGEKPVLVDFYAEWCIPCRQMKPYLEALARDRAASLRVERIDADDNQALLRELAIDGLPTLELYRRGTVVWKKTGFTSREDLLARLDAPR